MTGGKKLDLRKSKIWLQHRAESIWENLHTNNLWQRILKNTLATTITIIIAIIPAVVRIYGPAAYLAPITTVFGHPGRRFGMMAEALVLAVSGALLGIGWSTLGIWFSSLVISTNQPAAYTVKGVFLAVALLFHGFLRSHSPRLFIFVLLLVIVSVVSLTGRSTSVSSSLVTVLLYPILTAVAVLLLVNILVFPEFSSDFLGNTTIETLGETVGTLRDAGRYFITVVDKQCERMDREDELDLEQKHNTKTAAEKPLQKHKPAKGKTLISTIFDFIKSSNHSEKDNDTGEVLKPVKLKSLTDAKAKLRTKLAACKAAQQECNFELAWSVLPPRDLKPISDHAMKKLVANTISLIGACESKYALLGDEDDKHFAETKAATVPNVPDAAVTVEKGDSLSFLRTHVGSRTNTSNGSQHEASGEGATDAVQRSKISRRQERQEPKARSKSRSKSMVSLEREKEELELVKPKKEIEFGDAKLLRTLLGYISTPLDHLQEKIDRSVDVVTSSLAYCYDVKKLPSGALAPRGIQLEEIDIRVDILSNALLDFDRDTASSLEDAAVLNDLDVPQVDVMPRMETFLIASFLLNLRQAAFHTLEMLKHCRVIVEKRQARHDRRRLYPPNIRWRKWLASGGEEDMLAMPEGGRKDARTGRGSDYPKDDDEVSSGNEWVLRNGNTKHGFKKSEPANRNDRMEAENPISRPGSSSQFSLAHRLRNNFADCLEYLAGSEDVLYSVKLSVAVFLVTFPAFVYKWNQWFYINRGLWAALQLVLVTEVAIGTSVWTFILRAIGTTLGCIWGYLAYEAGNGNKIICVVILVIGIIPSVYIQLGSKYIKAGMVSIISMSIVTLATIDGTIPGTPTENFLKRLIAFLIGGVVALVVEVVLFPVRARDRLVESLAATIRQIGEMEACLAHGVESEANVTDIHSYAVSQRFDTARGKAQAALTAAETFLPFCDQEPRLKGSFKGLALIYSEILYVLHAIVDKMDNMLHLRYAYGSGVLEELNSQVYPYRRNVAGSITLILFAIHEALTTKLPLPQFLPSARLAHLRMVNRVREVVVDQGPDDIDGPEHGKSPARSQIEKAMVRRLVRKKYLAWNAASAGQIEVIEYLEELIDLVKLLVGANEFRSGLLTRPTYRDYVDRIDKETDGMARKNENHTGNGVADIDKENSEEARDTIPESEVIRPVLTKRRATSVRPSEAARRSREQNTKTQGPQSQQDELPRSLQRVRSRRLEELQLQRTRSKDHDSKMKGGNLV